MGLDLIELTLAVEDAFQLSIPDAEAAGLVTPGQLADYLETQLDVGVHSVCMEQRVFYALRRATIKVLGVTRAHIRPDTPWADYMPYMGRRRTWSALQHALSVVNWPRLTLRGTLPQRLSTIGNTAIYLATYAPGEFKRTGEAWSSQDIRRTIQHLMTWEFGIDTFNWTDHFVADLGLD